MTKIVKENFFPFAKAILSLVILGLVTGTVIPTTSPLNNGRNGVYLYERSGFSGVGGLLNVNKPDVARHLKISVCLGTVRKRPF